MTDREIKERWMQTLLMSPRELAEKIVTTHLRTMPHLQIKFAVWMNPEADPWTEGLEILEVCGRLGGSPSPDFRPVEFAPHDGWPRTKFILTDVPELVVDIEVSNPENSYAEKVKNLIKRSPDAVVHPKGLKDPVEEFRNLLHETV